VDDSLGQFGQALQGIGQAFAIADKACEHGSIAHDRVERRPLPLLVPFGIVAERVRRSAERLVAQRPHGIEGRG
jgi:hypothetical protein